MGVPVKQTGFIRNLPAGKTFGFLDSQTDGKTYFFHITQFKGDWSSLKSGDPVQYDVVEQGGRYQANEVEFLPGAPVRETPVKRPTKAPRYLGPYTGPDLGLSDAERLRSLTELSRWKLEAKLDDIKRYFFAIPELNDIAAGDASYVIGRKGTGKTALVQYLSDTANSNQHVSKLTFKNFPFNELYNQGNESYRRPNQYITIWKLIIYSAACRLIAKSEKCDPSIHHQCR